MKIQGFSLLELMFVLVIISLLGICAIPTYNKSLTETKSIEAKAALLNLANELEAYYSHHFTYQGFQSDLHLKWYKIIIQTTPEAFLLKAQSKMINNNVCQTYTLNHLGEKGIESAGMSAPSLVNSCWLI